MRWADIAIFFLDSGLGEVCAGNAWNLPLEGTGVAGTGWSVQPKGPVHCHWSILVSCMRVHMHGETRTSHTPSAPPPPGSDRFVLLLFRLW